MAGNPNETRFVFKVEWFDEMASLARPYLLSFYPADKTIDMYDLRNKRMFLKRCEYSAVGLEDIVLGAKLKIFSREIRVIDYGDLCTKKLFENRQERTLALIKPDAYIHIGKILDIIYKRGFEVKRIRMAKLTKEQARDLYKEQKDRDNFEAVTTFVASDVCVGIELVGDDVVERWRQLVGPSNSQIARSSAPSSLRALLGTDAIKNAVHGSASAESGIREIELFFGDKIYSTALLTNCSCLVIKPHIVKSGSAGKIIEVLLDEGFEISALEMFSLTKETAEEFFEVYKGVLPEFSGMVEDFISGPVLAMEVRQENAVVALRELVGPHDPDTARSTSPTSLRAQFGVNRISNAVHCTDLPEDGVLECEYFFSILKK